MKVKQVLSCGMLTAIIAISAFAQVKSKNVTFSRNVVVNGTAVKAGDYKLEFDSDKGELSVLKDRKIVAKTNARVETTKTKARATLIETTQSDTGDLLISIIFRGEDQRFVVANEGVGASKK